MFPQHIESFLLISTINKEPENKKQVTATPSLVFIINKISNVSILNYSTVTDFARFLGLSGSLPLFTAV